MRHDFAPFVALGLAVASQPADALAQSAPEPRETPRQAADPRRDFDFWVGRWDVHNRNLTPNGWVDSGTSRAEIRPILGGAAILEQWDGRAGWHAKTFGISVRCFDPALGRWVIALNWPSDAGARFSRMDGRFRHGRGEFFPPDVAGDAAPRATRFTFSDARPNSCRWDLATPVGDAAWRTSWIMEFSRSANEPAHNDRLDVTPPPDRPACADPRARAFDRFVGTFSGSGWRLVDGQRVDTNARFLATSANRGCATLTFFALESAGHPSTQRFTAWAFDAATERWLARTLTAATPRFRELVGTLEATGRGAFTQSAWNEADAHSFRVRYEAIDDDRFRRRHEISTDDGATWTTALDVELTRN